MKTKTKLALAAFAALSMVTFTSCHDDENYTGGQSTPSEEMYDKLTDDAISEFLAFAKNPRPGNTAEKHDNLDKARDYLVNWANQHGYTVNYDSHPNIWIDVPANSSSMASMPTVILQGHIDMVCASAAGETYDYTQVVGEPYYDGDLLKGRKVNLGADDGIGVGMALAIAASDVPHGPLRLLFTANEDYDMEGAINLEPDVINSDYLICLDEEEIGKVSSGCLGSYIVDFNADYTPVSDLSGKSIVKFVLTGLPGGHSGVMIGNNILSATTVTSKIIKDVITPVNGSIISIECGAYNNAIADATTIEFAVDNLTVGSQCFDKIDDIMDDFKAVYGDQTGTYTMSQREPAEDDNGLPAAINDTLNSFFAKVEQGVVERDEINVVTKSRNIGVVRSLGGSFQANCMFRSYYSEWLESEKERLVEVRGRLGMYGSSEFPYVPSWSVKDGNSFRDNFLVYYKETWPSAFTERAYGGLECAYFVLKRPTLKAIAVGPQLDGAHSIDEAVHVSTIKPLMKAIVKMLQHMDEMK